jgi:hypothetical protein
VSLFQTDCSFHIVREIEFDFFEREVGKRDLLSINDIAVAIVTGKSGGLVGMNEKFPYLEGFPCDLLVIRLNYGDFVKEPIGSVSATYFAPSVNNTARLIPC